MSKPKVLIYSDCYIYGGSERLMCFLLKNKLINEQFDLIFSYRHHKSYSEGLQNDRQKLKINSKIFPLFILANETIFFKINQKYSASFIRHILKLPFFLANITGLYFLCNYLRFFFFLKNIDPAIVHINNGGYPGAESCNHLTIAAKSAGIKSIIYQVNNIASVQTGKFNSGIDKFINKNVSFFITASAKAKKALIDNRNFSPKKILQIPNTVVIESTTKIKKDFITMYNWPDDTFLIVQVAFLTKRKGQIYLIKAIEEIININASLKGKLKVILIGDGEDESILAAYIADKNLTDNIILAGYRTDSPDFIKACDIFVLPSISNEDMPLALLTAMSFSIPVIATNFAGIGEAIKNNFSGILLDADTKTLSENLVSSIIELYENPSKRKDLGENAYEEFYRRFSEITYGKRIVDLYHLLNTISVY